MSEGYLFRTVFNWMNEDDHQIPGELRLFSMNGDAFEAEFTPSWVGEKGRSPLLEIKLRFQFQPSLRCCWQWSRQLLLGQAWPSSSFRVI